MCRSGDGGYLNDLAIIRLQRELPFRYRDRKIDGYMYFPIVESQHFRSTGREKKRQLELQNITTVKAKKSPISAAKLKNDSQTEPNKSSAIGYSHKKERKLANEVEHSPSHNLDHTFAIPT
jgi:hypothetical protein